MSNNYLDPGPTRDELDSSTGLKLLEFGAPWCGHCQLAAPAVEETLAEFPGVEHVKVEDGPGRPLGRSFRVKLWPTLIALRDGAEAARAVRPETADAVRALLRQL
ncbi:MAG: thioredoxin family protein [Planctomycetaceae bacterium]|nr:thioredoxin family protein [Planctomycetaceae bacterium]